MSLCGGERMMKILAAFLPNYICQVMFSLHLVCLSLSVMSKTAAPHFIKAAGTLGHVPKDTSPFKAYSAKKEQNVDRGGCTCPFSYHTFHTEFAFQTDCPLFVICKVHL